MTKSTVRAAALLILVTTMAVNISTASGATRPQMVTEAQNGKTVVLAKSALLVVALESNPGTGYSWRISKHNAAIVKFVDQSAFPPGTPKPGAPDHQLFKFQAFAPGSDSIELEYLRPWEKGVAPAKKFVIKVTVK